MEIGTAHLFQNDLPVHCVIKQAKRKRDPQIHLRIQSIRDIPPTPGQQLRSSLGIGLGYGDKVGDRRLLVSSRRSWRHEVVSFDVAILDALPIRLQVSQVWEAGGDVQKFGESVCDAKQGVSV